MKNIMKRIFAALLAALLVMALATTAFAHSGRTDGSGGHKDNKNKSGLGSYHYHCGGSSAHLHVSGYCPYTDIFPTGVSVKAEKKTLGIGEKVNISATVYPENACSTRVSWSSSDPSVASVYNGVITAKAYGTTTITAETFNEKKGTVTITVKEITAEKVTVSGLPEVDVFYIGDAFTLTAQISPENVDNPTIVWSSSNEQVASVSETGSVTLLAEGKAEIRATASNGVFGKVAVVVKEKYVEAVEIAESELDVLLGDQRNIAAKVSPSDATYPELTWTSENPDVVSVDGNGNMTAVGCGQTVITATARNGLSDSVVVRVSEIKAQSLEIQGAPSVLLGGTMSLTGAFTPADTTVQDITWSVDNAEVASVSPDGLLTANGVGTVTVTATQKDVSATFVVEILPIKVESIVLTASTEENLSKDDTVTFSAEVFPANATYPEITWSVSDPEVATIDENGVLHALKAGKVTVTATAGDGFTSEYEVTVSSPFALVLAIAVVLVIIIVISSARRKKKKNK